MFIHKVITYKGAWEKIISKNQNELRDILSAISDTPKENLFTKIKSIRIPKHFLEKALRERDWDLIDHRKSKQLKFGALGPKKNDVCAAMPLSLSGNFLTQWIFNISAIAIKERIIDIPILITGINNVLAFENRKLDYSQFFEIYLKELKILSPIYHAHPFLIIGFSDKYNENDIEVFNLDNDNVAKRIEKSIEFPAEYHAAGLNILNFFGTYLREQYPNENAKVKIEQDGLIVRLIVESKDGRLEVIERALHEYQLIVTGKHRPEDIITNSDFVRELKNELRFAILRIEMQMDKLETNKERIYHLEKMLELALSNKPAVNIEFKPTISNSNMITINPDIDKIIKDLNELKSSIDPQDPLYSSLKEIQEPLKNIKNEQNPEVVKHSSAMVKLKEFVEKVSKGNDEIDKTLKVATKGWDTFKEIAGTYNSIAQWCGLPQVPTIFTK